ncbi:hypothetical protein NXF25_018930 [Crotalus adamanteus]|uniref:Uncharacterized protein n=1 Tax=Crotalus adamanteus TaxID=8729 RepID=A0AAW1B0C7_CROAD
MCITLTPLRWVVRPPLCWDTGLPLS